MGQIGGVNSIAGGDSGVERLGHGAEILPQAASRGRGYPQSMDHLVETQTKQIPRSRRCAQNADDAGRVPAGLIKLRLRRCPDFAGNFGSDQISRYELPSAGIHAFCRCHDGRKNDGTRVPNQPPGRIVIIQGVAKNPVYKRSL